jgi:hypothetical protein
MAITVKHKFVSAIPDGTDATIVRPSNWNDDHDLVGLGTVAEQNANAVAITGGTVSGTTLTNDTVSNNLNFTPTTAPSYLEGRVWYDSTEKALAFYNDSSALAVHVSQDLIVKVINNTGTTIPNGSPVYVTGTSSGQTYPNVALAKADLAATSSVIGLTNGAIANGATGYVTSQGIIDNVNTGTFTVGQVLYLSPYSAGQLMNTIPPTGITVQVGVATFINSSTGHIYVKQTTPLAVPASIITGQVAVANGGTGASTASGARTNLGFGTIATQDANAVAITGGTIDNTVIGGTTPAAGTFTTITGQTEVLKGTGQNLVVQSQAFATSWNNSGLTLANNATTAPDTTNTASSLTETATTAVHWAFTQTGLNLYAGTYTASCYLKANGRTAATIAISRNTTNQYVAVTFDLSGVVVSQTNVAGSGFSATSSSITSVGSGWYRCVLTAATPSGSDYLFMVSTSNATTFSPNSVGGANSYLGDITKGIYAWGGQLEPSATVGTYVPTTTTILLGNPSLSLGGFASLGMENTGAVYLQPALTGALQAQATTSTTVGGNARGANAVDWQTARNSASQVASSTQSVVGGGFGNTASNVGSTVAGGALNVVNQPYAGILSGQSNAVTANYASVVGGSSNTGSGYYGFVGGGTSNSTTSSSAVTTQSATMNGTTAVTLSGSNANIKVGQMITGTSITFPNTYVAAISGTSLTLSQNASGSSTSTLSFYTPHGVVVGGGNNQATGSYSFIGGGGDAGTAGQRNTSSGDWSVVCGGAKNTASGAGSFIGGGGLNSSGLPTWGNTASGLNSSSVGGQGSSATGNYSFVGGGFINAANSTYSAILGGSYGTTRSIIGNAVFPAHGNPIAESNGVSQSALLVLAVQTTDATATALRSNGSAASGTNQVILPNNSAYYFKGEVISGVTGGGDTKGWEISGVIKRGVGVGTATLVGSTVTSLYADAGAATWTIAVTADTTNGGLRVTFTGQASTTIRTVCQIRTTEMTY